MYMEVQPVYSPFHGDQEPTTWKYNSCNNNVTGNVKRLNSRYFSRMKFILSMRIYRQQADSPLAIIKCILVAGG
jgi:hypothetical protein